MENVTRKVERMARRNAKRKLWRRVVAVPAALVVFVTTYALILPAIAMERETYCGYEAHTHDDTCYTDVLICGLEEGEQTEDAAVRELACPEVEALHKHDLLKCYNAKGELICGYADYMVHQHDENCYINGVLVCPLTEVKEHEHTDACYNVEQVLSCGLQEQEGHVHDDSCYTVTESRDLTCGQEESAGHTHTDACYQIKDNTYLTCTQEESAGHTHTDACYTIHENTYLACGQEESAGHTHTDACYTIHENTYLACGQEEGPDHTHTDACYKTEQTKELTCGQEEVAGHTHDASCYVTEQVKELTCGQEESAGHTHDASCYTTEQTKELVCGQEESAGHTHTDACYTTTELRELTCGKAEQEGHTHTDECYTEKKTLICGKKEVILHTHTASCFDEYGKLTCTQLEVKKHQHDENCFVEHELEAGQGHVHTEACYEHVLTCDKPEHIHTMLCYVNVEEEMPAPTAEKNAAPAGSESQQPDTTPAEDDFIITLPEITSTPETSEEPEATAEPEVTEEPEATAEPEVTEEPETTEEPEATPEATEAPEPVLVCGLEEHTHTEDCYEAGQIVCGLEEHTHTDDCWAVPETSEEPEATPEATEAPMNGFDWGWGIPEGPSFDGQIIIPVPSATPEATAEPTAEPTATPEPTPEPTPLPVADVRILVCEKEEHVHDANCIMGEEYICGKDAHVHNDDCYVTVQAMLMCGMYEHTHTEACYDENGVLVCELPEHTHSAECIGDIVSADDGIMDLPMSGEPMIIASVQRLDPYVTKLNAENTKYDPNSDTFTTDFSVEFKVTKDQLRANGLNYEFTIPAGVELPSDADSTHRTAKDSGDKDAFEYWFTENPDGSHTLHVNVLENYYNNEMGSELEGYVKVKGAKTKEKNKNGLHVHFFDKADDSVDLDVWWKDIETVWNVKMRKELDNTQAADGKLHYKIIVWTNTGTPDDVTLSDILSYPEGIEGVTGPENLTVTVSDCNEYGSELSNPEVLSPDKYSITKDSSDPNKFTVTLDQIEKSSGYKAYVVEYDYLVDTNKLPDGSTKFSNHAYGTSGGWSGDGTTEYYFDRNFIEKSGTLEGQKIKWTITVNKSKADIAGWTLTDEYFQNVSKDGLAFDPPDNHYTVNEVDGHVTSVVFDDDGTGSNKQTYTITYYTDADHTGTYENTAELEGEPGEGSHSGSGSVTVSGNTTSSKEMLGSSVDGENMVYSWKAQLTIPTIGILKDAEFSDLMYGPPNAWDTKGPQWMTKEQITKMLDGVKDQEWYGKVEWSFEVMADDGSITPKTFENLNPEDHVVGFTFKAKEDIPYNVFPDGKIQLSYDTTTKKDLGGNYRNSFAGYDVYFEQKPDSVVKTDKGGQHDKTTIEINPDGTITWKVKVTMGSSHNTGKIVDTLPDGVELESLSYHVKDEWKDYTAQITGSGTYETKYNGEKGVNVQVDGQTVTLEFGPEQAYALQAGKEIEITYNCKLTDEMLDKYAEAIEKDGIHTESFDNNVHLWLDDEDKGGDNQTQDVVISGSDTKTDHGKVDKGSTYDAVNGRIKFHIDINKDGVVITGTDEEGNELPLDYLTLTDILTYEDWPCPSAWFGGNFGYKQVFTLLTGSVQLYYAEMGADGKPVIDPETGKMVASNEKVSGWEWLDYSEEHHESEKPQSWHHTDGERGPEWVKSFSLRIPNDGRPMVLVYEYQVELIDQHSYDYEVPLIQSTNEVTLEGWADTDDVYTEEWTDSSIEAGARTNGYTLKKVEAGDFTKTLEGAKFQLWRLEKEGDSLVPKLVVADPFETDDDGQLIVHLTTAEDLDGNKTYTLKICDARGEEAEVEVPFDPNCVYYWEEIEAPSGYKKAEGEAARRYFYAFVNGYNGIYKIDDIPGYADVKKNITNLLDGDRLVYIQNEAAETYVLPETGGEGTIVFTLAGMAVMALAGAVYCDKRRRLLAKGAVTAPGVQFTAGRPERPAGQVKGGDRLIK